MRLLGAIGLSLCLVTTSRAEEITLAVAANFTAPMQLLETRFEARSEHRLRVAYGSSGGLYAQIVNGAPFDIFLSADQIKVDALYTEQMIADDSRFTYAVGALALWSPNPQGIQAELEALTQGDFRRLAIANPELAPYGLAALELLQSLGIDDQVEARLVMGENIAQAYQFVASGAADLGLVALSQLVGGAVDPPGSYWIVPRDFYAPILQDAVVLKRAADSAAAGEFMQFLRSPQAAEIIRAHGYLRLASD